MSRATELMLNAHDLNELDMFRRYLRDMHTMNFRKFYRKYQAYMGLSNAELADILKLRATRSTPAMERNVRFGGSLGPLLRLKKSIPLTVERPFVLIWENTEEYSQGDSLGQAMDDFGISVRQLWEKVHDGSPLGPELLRIRSLLEEYIEPQPGPAAPPATKEGK